MYLSIHTRKDCILPCRRNYIPVNIVALYAKRPIPHHHILGFLARPRKKFCRGKIIPLLRQKRPLPARCHIKPEHRRFNGYRAAAAERVNQNPVPFPRGQHKKRCRQRFRKRCLARKFSVAPLVQGFPGCVNPNRNLILHNCNPDGITRAALRKPIHMVLLFQPLDHRLLHN